MAIILEGRFQLLVAKIRMELVEHFFVFGLDASLKPGHAFQPDIGDDVYEKRSDVNVNEEKYTLLSSPISHNGSDGDGIRKGRNTIEQYVNDSVENLSTSTLIIYHP